MSAESGGGREESILVDEDCIGMLWWAAARRNPSRRQRTGRKDGVDEQYAMNSAHSQGVAQRGLGYSLFLGLIIDRLHHYIRELRTMKKNMEAVTKQGRVLEEAKLVGAEEIQGYQKEIASLNEQVQVLKHQSETKTEELKTAGANALALRKQSEGLLIEYERLIAENEELRNKLQSIDHRLSHSDSKKNS